MDLKAAEQYIVQRLEKELDPRLTYHNTAHTLSVRDAVRDLARMEGVNESALVLLETAALFHDSGFLVSRDEHEAHSADIAREALPQYGYTHEETNTVCALIMATRSGHSPSALEECIMRDADLFYLGTENYTEVSERLKEELLNFELLRDEKDWIDLQIRFLEHHHYYTESAARQLDAGKKNTLTLLKKQAHV